MNINGRCKSSSSKGTYDKEHNDKNKIIKSIIFLSIIVWFCIMLYKYANPFFRLLYLYICIVFIIPIATFYLKTLICSKSYDCRRHTNKQQGRSSYYPNTIIENDYEQNNNNKYTPKIMTDKEYIKLQTTFKTLLQNKKLSHRQILEFKKIINLSLHDHLSNYQNFKFKNDAHEIFVKFKSSAFSTINYQELYNELIRISGGLNEVENDVKDTAITDMLTSEN